jgi:hypothetical protein
MYQRQRLTMRLLHPKKGAGAGRPEMAQPARRPTPAQKMWAEGPPKSKIGDTVVIGNQ